LTRLPRLIYNIALINTIAGLFVALLLVVLAGFLAIPALRRLRRTIHLTRKGKIAAGRALSSTSVVFFLEEKKRIEFVTGRNFAVRKRPLEVLYDAERPEQAEVWNTKMLWVRPVDTLVEAVGLLTMASALVLGVNDVLALGLFVGCVVFLWLLVRLLLLLVILSVKYRPFHRLGTHVLAGFQITKKPYSHFVRGLF